MATHIFRVKKRMDRTEAVYAEITDYREVNGVPKHFYPVVRYETTEGRTVSSVYTVAAKSKIYEVGVEEIVYQRDLEGQAQCSTQPQWRGCRVFLRF